jgi:glycosyltransferase 2 family protein
LGSKIKNILKTVLKFIVSGAALYIVSRNIDWQLTKDVLFNANIVWLSVATVFFIASKIMSSLRLNLYFKNIGLSITEKFNLRLYWIGMFYNLFLPGGIGGDGYKVYLLNQKFGTKVKPLIHASLLDRISGLVALLILAGLGYLAIDQNAFPSWLLAVVWAGIILALPIYYFVLKWLFSDFVSSYISTTFYSFTVQIFQVICAFFILISVGVDDHYLSYQVLFLISSVVAIFPFTVGGFGARELTFILGYQYLGIDQNVAVAFSLLFFLITAVVSLVGGFLKTR